MRQGLVWADAMAQQFNPDADAALDSRGLVSLKLGNSADAIRNQSQSIEKNPRSVSSLFGRGIPTMKIGDHN
jgi:hypothetical protein